MAKRTPDEKFALYVKAFLGFFAVSFVYFIIADLYMPMTPQARLYYKVTQVTPRLNGHIIDVHVGENQEVREGDLLFTIDSTPFELAYRQAQLQYDEALLKNQQLDADILATKADIEAAKATLNERNGELQRAKSLIGSKAISQQETDRIIAQAAAAKASLQALQAELTRIRVERGSSTQDNLLLKQAKTAVDVAKLNFTYTTVRAPADGVISNMQVTTGTFAKQGTPLATLVTNNADLVADFREKSLLHVTEDSRALVVFDALPGEVFNAQIHDFEAGVSDGQLTPDGSLSKVEASNRWVRDAQRQRLHLVVSPESSERTSRKLTSGARATVQILPEPPLAQFFAEAQITFVSYLHFVY